MSSPEHTVTTILTSAGEMPAQVWTPPGGQGPGVLLLQEIFGVSAYIRRRAAALAEAGYTVVAPELYWRLDPSFPPLDESAPDVIEAAMQRASALDWGETVADATAGLSWLQSREGGHPVGVMGFCFGGGLAFNVAAVAEPACLVSYYGSSLPELVGLAPQVECPSLHHFGLADVYIPEPEVARIRDRLIAEGRDVVFETYEGANHAFDNDDLFLHHAPSARLAWERTVAFLREHLQAPAG